MKLTEFPSKNATTVLKPHFFLVNLIVSLLGSGIATSQNHESRYSKRKIFYNHSRWVCRHS